MLAPIGVHESNPLCFSPACACLATTGTCYARACANLILTTPPLVNSRRPTDMLSRSISEPSYCPSPIYTTEPNLCFAMTHRAPCPTGLALTPLLLKVNYFLKCFLYTSPPPSNKLRYYRIEYRIKNSDAYIRSNTERGLQPLG